MVKLVTGKEGTVSLHNLPIGSYYLKETDVGNHHFVLDPEVKEFYVSMELENKRQKIELVLTKQSKETKEPVQGAVFGLYAEEDILDLTGEVIVKAGEFLAKAESAEDGTIRFDIDHPHGKYMVKELEATLGYLKTEETWFFDATYQNPELEVISLAKEIENQPTVVEITKTDITDDKEVEGAKLQILDKDGGIVEEWVSTKESHKVYVLEPGEYILHSKEFYHEAGIEPLSWESDYIDPDYGATCIKLSYEEYIAPVEPIEPVDPEPTEPSTPDPVTPPSGGETGKTDQEPTDPPKVEPSDTENPSSGENEGNKDTEIPPTTDTGEDKKDNSISEPSKDPDSSQTKEEQEVNNVDNSQHNSTTNNRSSVGGNTTNSSSVSNTDNSRSESSRTENSNNSSTVNNYYQQDKQEPATASTNASQPVNVTVPVTVSTPEAKGSNTATPEAPETTSIADKNINIEAKGVDVKLEITGDSYNISISAPEGQESQIQPVNEVSTVNTPESTTEPQRSPNWIEYITVILLAVLVGLEIKDKLHKEK